VRFQTQSLEESTDTLRRSDNSLGNSYVHLIEREVKDLAASQNVVWFHRTSNIPECKMLTMVCYISTFHKKMSQLVCSSCFAGSALWCTLFALLKIQKCLKARFIPL